MMKRAAWATLVVLTIGGLAGCRTAGPRPAPPQAGAPTVPAKPAFEKTFGEAYLTGGSSISVLYKDMRVLVDPNRSALLSEGVAEGTDFVLITRAGTIPDVQWSAIRRDQKMLAPEPAAKAAREAGFPNAKGVGGGQRMMLSKNEAFLFATAVQARNPASGELVNGYLLEFDNGKNIFVTGEIVDAAVVREFVYQIRDDGKELEMVFVTTGARKAADGTLRSADEAMAAELSSLLQPKFAILLEASSLNRKKLEEAFQSQIMNGQWYLPSTPEKIPF